MDSGGFTAENQRECLCSVQRCESSYNPSCHDEIHAVFQLGSVCLVKCWRIGAFWPQGMAPPLWIRKRIHSMQTMAMCPNVTKRYATVCRREIGSQFLPNAPRRMSGLKTARSNSIPINPRITIEQSSSDRDVPREKRRRNDRDEILAYHRNHESPRRLLQH